jgi:parallel beta-helix repeat protein
MSSAANITRILLLVVLASSAYAVTDCTTISVPGAYVLENSITDTGALLCINISVSDVSLNGQGFTVDGIDTAASIGIYAYNSTTTLNNITIGNVTTSDWNNGIHYNNTENGSIINSTSLSNTANGFFITTSSDGNSIADNTAYNNSAYGFRILLSNWNNLTENTAYNNSASGFYLDYANSSILTGNLGYNNTQHGFLARAYNSALVNNTAYENTMHGFYLVFAQYNTMTGNMAHNNDLWGFYVALSHNNTFIDTTMYGNLEVALVFNNALDSNFTNTLIYNQTRYINKSASSASANFTNLTLGYNATIGLVNYNFLNMTSLYLNSTNFKLDPYFVSLDDSSAPQANLSVNITLYSVCNSTVEPSVYKLAGFPASRAAIVSGGSVYPTETSCGSGTMTFDALGFSGYALGPITTTLSLNFSPSNLTTYKTETNVSCTADNGVVAIGLYVNGTLVAGPSTNSIEYLTNHSGGYYNYTCNTTGNENYSSAVNASVLYTQRASPTITFNVTPSTPTTVGNETNLSCSVDNTQATVEIFVDDVSVGSAVQQFEYLNNLTVGTYNFTCNTTGNENYTNASGSLNGYEVEQRNTVLDLTIPLLPLAGEQTDVSCSANTDEVNISLYRNGVRVANGTVQVDDIAVLPPALYTYVCNTTGSDNYTSYSTSGILRFKRSSTSSSAAQCNLEVVVPDNVVAGSAMQLQVLRSTDGNPGTSVYLATVAIAGEGEAATLTTGTNGHVSFVPASAGTYSYAAEFGDCEGADGTFTVVEAEEELPVEEEPAAPPEEPSAEPSGGETSGSTGQPVGTETPVETTPECIVDSDCGAGFGCEGGACVETAGQPAAQGVEVPGVEAASVPRAQQGVPWWAWLLIVIVLGAGAYWFLSRKKA